MENTINLAPCPFCHFDREAWEYHKIQCPIAEPYHNLSPELFFCKTTYCYAIKCRNCLVVLVTHFKNIDDASGFWNERTDPWKKIRKPKIIERIKCPQNGLR